ncbi:MAG: hypothetical protein DCC71_19550 [Proteobacteria bacterium]|nr:MAG: hypothetical protein DCC71_19550 [Pseudomonadota bacterium]
MRRLAAWALACVALVAAATWFGVAHPRSRAAAPAAAALPALAPPPWSDGPAGERSALEAEFGIRLLGIRRVAAGYALDLRFRVVDPERAAPVLQRKHTPDPHLVVEKSGAELRVPRTEKVGTLRQSVRTPEQIKPGRHYFVLFANPGRHVEPGDAVTVVIGAFRLEHVTVL